MNKKTKAKIEAMTERIETRNRDAGMPPHEFMLLKIGQKE